MAAVAILAYRGLGVSGLTGLAVNALLVVLIGREVGRSNGIARVVAAHADHGFGKLGMRDGGDIGVAVRAGKRGAMNGLGKGASVNIEGKGLTAGQHS